METIENIPVQRVTAAGKEDTEEKVVREMPLTLMLNNHELVTMLCTPADMKYLAVGFLSSEGFLSSKTEIKKVLVDEKRGVVRVEAASENKEAREVMFKRLITSGCGRGASFYSAVDTQEKKVESNAAISAIEVFNLVKEFQHRSEVFLATGGVHSAALCDAKQILVFNEDIGRHNAIDKIFGECLLNDITTNDRFILTSGRISSEILLKVSRRNIPILISKSAPTTLGVKLADKLGITLIGFVRGQKMNVYSHGWRVT